MISAKTFAAALANAVASMTLFSGAAFALDETWVSGTGTGAACTRAAPCEYFLDAYNATAEGGAISVLDSGAPGFMSITKSITVRAIGSVAGGVMTGTGSSWVLVNVASTKTVVLDGLSFVGGGIHIRGAGTVVIRNCRIGFNNNASLPNTSVYGIRIAPDGPLRVVISDTFVENNGNTSGGAGIWVIPQGSGSTSVMLERVTASHNRFGVAVDGSQSMPGINLTIRDSTLSANEADGLVVVTTSGKAPIQVSVSNTASTNNGVGIRSIGPNVRVRVKNSEITGNTTGLSALSGGVLLSGGVNTVEANTTDGAFTGSYALK
jgi:hypothetical protein